MCDLLESLVVGPQERVKKPTRGCHCVTLDQAGQKTAMLAKTKTKTHRDSPASPGIKGTHYHTQPQILNSLSVHFLRKQHQCLIHQNMTYIKAQIIENSRAHF